MSDVKQSCSRPQVRSQVERTTNGTTREEGLYRHTVIERRGSARRQTKYKHVQRHLKSTKAETAGMNNATCRNSTVAYVADGSHNCGKTDDGRLWEITRTGAWFEVWLDTRPMHSTVQVPEDWQSRQLAMQWAIQHQTTSYDSFGYNQQYGSKACHCY